MKEKQLEILVEYIRKSVREGAFDDDNSGNDDNEQTSLQQEVGVDNIVDAASIKVSLNGDFLAMELRNRFKKLSDFRASIIIRSHMELFGGSETDNDQALSELAFEDIPSPTSTSLLLSPNIPTQARDEFALLLMAIFEKRNNRGKDTKVLSKDSPERSCFLKFLKVCWNTSGGQAKGDDLLSSSRMAHHDKLALIREMEKLVADRLSQFLSLDYKICVEGMHNNILTIFLSQYFAGPPKDTEQEEEDNCNEEELNSQGMQKL